MTSAAEIVRLGPGDIDLVRRWLRMFGEAFENDEAYARRQPDDAYLTSLLARPDFIALAARDGPVAVGGLAAYVLTKFEQPRSEVYVYDLAVAASHRRRGIATALIERLKQESREVGAFVIFVQADLADAPAIALYDRLGRREEVLHFDIEP